MEKSQKRQVAYKVKINDILKGEYIKEEGEWSPNYIVIEDKKDNYFSYNDVKDKQYDKLADLFRKNMDMKMFYNILKNS